MRVDFFLDEGDYDENHYWILGCKGDAGMLRFIMGWLGMNPGLPFIWEVTYPVHGQYAKNKQRQKVVFDTNQLNPVTGQPGKWVMPQNFSDRKPVTVTKG